MVALQRAQASLFEITAVHKGVGLDLRSLISDEALRVREVSGSAHLHETDVVVAWVMEFPDHREFTGAVFAVKRAHVERVRGPSLKRPTGPGESAIGAHAGAQRRADLALPGKIPIRQVRALRRLQREQDGGALFARFMVRGHWRRAPDTWRDRHPRWIAPYWKGPPLGDIVERDYALKP